MTPTALILSSLNDPERGEFSEHGHSRLWTASCATVMFSLFVMALAGTIWIVSGWIR